jgi:hypothetical protein
VEIGFAIGAVLGLFLGLLWLLGRTSRNDDSSTHGGGLDGHRTGVGNHSSGV